MRFAPLAVLAAIFIGALAPRLDPDLWWHLRTGQAIVEQQAVPRADPFSFTFAGRPWLNHEWLAEVVMHGAERAGGMAGLLFFIGLALTAAFVVAWLRMQRRNVDPPTAATILGLAFYAGSMSWGPRVQILSLLFASLFAWALELRKMWLLPALMLIWANLHGSFAIGLGMLVLTIIGELIETRDARSVRPLGISFTASLVAAVINPNGVQQLLYPLRFLLPNPFTKLIVESGSPNFHSAAMVAFEVLLLIAIAAAARGWCKLRWTDVLYLLAFTHLALSQSRNVAVWAVVVTPIVAELAGALPRLIAIPAAIAAVVLPLLTARSFNTSVEELEARDYPAAATRVLQQTALPPRLFTTYHWGGYAIDRLYPRYRVFIDGRADTLYDGPLLDEYFAAYNGSPEWRAIFARRGVTTALVEKRSFIAVELLHAPEWQLVYHDAQAAVFTRRASSSAMPSPSR
jgi:hypothetical protein